MERQITQSEVVTAAADALRHDTYHVYPGNIVSYDEGQETCTVQPGTNDVRFDIDSGARISAPAGPIQGVPVAWPRFGGFVIKGSLNPYDPVMLIALDLDPTPWRKAGRTLKPVDPGDVRRHGGGYWFVLPTDITLARKPSSAGGKLTIGAEGQQPLIVITGSTIQLGATGGDAVALAHQTDANFQAVVDAAAAAILAVVPDDGGAGAFTAFKNALLTKSVASTLIKAQ